MINNLIVTTLKNSCYLQSTGNNGKIIFYSDLVLPYTSNDMKNLYNKFNITKSFCKKGHTIIR